MSNQKGFVSILIVILIIATVVGGAYYLGARKSASVVPTTSPVITSTPQSSSVSQPTLSPNPDETTNWKIYTNTKYNYLLKYPNNLPVYNGSAKSKEDETVGMDTTNSVIFGCSGFDAGVCLPTFSIGKSSLSETQTNDIFNLKVGDQVNKGMTYTLGGMWNQKTNYIKLADQVANGVSFLVLDNPDGYGGSNRIWFLRKNSTILQFNCIYANQNVLNICQNIISTFKFTQ